MDIIHFVPRLLSFVLRLARGQRGAPGGLGGQGAVPAPRPRLPQCHCGLRKLRRVLLQNIQALKCLLLLHIRRLNAYCYHILGT